MDVDAAYSLVAGAIDSGRVAHGYLIVGEIAGNVSELTDRILNKLFPGDEAQIAAKSHPDITYLEPSGAKRIITVDDMRERIVNTMSLASFSGGWKVGVIVNADRMLAPSANAFLKSLEEPTPKTLYLLLTDQPDSILPTIISRTQRIDLRLGEDLLVDEDFERVAAAFAARNVKDLAAFVQEVKDAMKKAVEHDEDTTEYHLTLRRYFKTLLSFVRKIMVDGKIPRYQAYRNVEAVEEAAKAVDSSLPVEMVISFMMDRITMPK